MLRTALEEGPLDLLAGQVGGVQDAALRVPALAAQVVAGRMLGPVEADAELDQRGDMVSRRCASGESPGEIAAAMPPCA